MQHHFEIEDAKKYGIEKAILIENFRFWITKNKANKNNVHDDRVWTFNSAVAYTKLFPYWNRQKISRLLRELEDEGVLTSGNYNKHPYDRTKWYSLNEKSLVKNLTMENKEPNKTESESEQPIPDINSDSKPDKKNVYTEEFETFWKDYPRRVNKAGAFKCWKARIKEKVDIDTLMLCLKNYKARLTADGTEFKFTMHPTTFLNKDLRFEDFLEVEEEQTGTYIDKNGAQFVDGVKTGHWDGSRFIPGRIQEAE